MFAAETLLVFDISAALIMVLIAYLSKQLGAALKIRPFYKILYLTTGLVSAAAAIDLSGKSFTNANLILLTLGFRATAGVAALVVCLPYWRWLFGEYFSKQR